jgi:hypothetical protein
VIISTRDGRRRLVIRLIVGATTLYVCLFVATAEAEWSVSVKGPDVFGNTKIVAIGEGGRSSMVIQCDQKDKLIIGYISRKKEFEETNSFPTELLIQVNGSGNCSTRYPVAVAV